MNEQASFAAMFIARWARRMFLLLGIGSPVYAADPDVVVLTSGNRMTGSVNELARGELDFSIDGAGSVSIDWTNVVSLTCGQDLDIELASGERLSGSVASPDSGKLEVKTATGPRVVDMTDVVGMTPIAATFLGRTSGSVEAGFSALQAQEEVDLTLDAEAANRTRNWLTEVSVNSLLRLRDGADQTRNQFTLGSRRFVYNRWFGVGRLQLEQDEKLDLDLRLVLAGGLGRTLVQSHRFMLALYGGLDYDLESYIDIDAESSAEAFGTVEWDWFEPGGNLELDVLGTTYVGLTRSRARFDLDADLRHDIVTDYYVSLGFFGRYDTDPPGDLDKSDYGIDIALGRSF